jgi:hypothetical protein
MNCFRRVGGGGCFVLTSNASSLFALGAGTVCEGCTCGWDWSREWGKSPARVPNQSKALRPCPTPRQLRFQSDALGTARHTRPGARQTHQAHHMVAATWRRRMVHGPGARIVLVLHRLDVGHPLHAHL